MANFILDFYKDEDLYSDGDIENEILELVKQGTPLSDIPRKQYPILYHLSPIRENIINWYPFAENARILEVGAGCGAITGALCEKAGKKGRVVAVDLSKRRAGINYERHKDLENLDIFVGNLNDIHFQDLFDYIVLNGVLEYAMSFTDTNHPYEDFLNNMLRNLKPDGKLLVAIENKYGLKYFAGAPEDHTDTMFLGLNSYEGNNSVRTFGRQELKELLSRVGLPHTHFYYPYPDYKFPNEIFTDESADSFGYGRDYYNLNGERFLFFNESETARGLAHEGAAGVIANSFLVAASRNEFTEAENLVYAKLNTDRNPEYRIMTKITDTPSGRQVEKTAIGKEAVAHIDRMISHANSETEGIVIPVASDTNKDSFTYGFIENETLSQRVKTLLLTKNESGILQIIQEFFDAAFSGASDQAEASEEFQKVFGSEYGFDNERLHSCISPANIDLILDNVFCEENTYRVIDCEWVFDFPVPVAFIKWRALRELLHKYNTLRLLIPDHKLLFHFGIHSSDEEIFDAWNKHFVLEYVGAEGLRNYAIPKNTLDFYSIYDGVLSMKSHRSYLFTDVGEGFSSAGITGTLHYEDGQFSLSFSLPQGSERVRFIPMRHAFFTILDLHVECDTEVLEISNNGEAISETETEFSITEPEYIIRMGKGATFITFSGRIEVWTPERIFGKLSESRAKLALLDREVEKYRKLSEEAEVPASRKPRGRRAIKRPPIDIVIPIYNAYDDLTNCIDSVKRHTDLKKDRLILINDQSTDERIRPYLQSLESENIIFVDNETNRGFSNNVNFGMQYSDDRDVLLLNSDTIVTKGWLDKIYRCAYSSSEIGTVTPMSNSATLCSYPVFCSDNKIPENHTVDSLAAVVEWASMRAYPRITVAVGFCMFIKREAINTVGLFDAETFGRGYGEENDFCNRAEQAGFIHVMCDDTFIYHKGTVSFVNEEKQKLISAHDRILNERYPAQMKKNSDYCNSNPDQYIRDNIDIYAKVNPDRPNLMYILHSDFREDAEDHMGGTQVHVHGLVNELKDRCNIYVAARDREYLRVTVYSDNNVVSLKYKVGLRDSFPKAENRELRNLFSQLFTAFKIDLLHVHHLQGFSLDIVHEARAQQIPVLLTMHDYYYICPNVKLYNHKGSHCSGYRDFGDCEQCLKAKAGISTGMKFLTAWRSACREMLLAVDRIIVPSEAASKIVSLYYKDDEIREKLTVIEHGMDFKEPEQPVYDEEKTSDVVEIHYDAFEENSVRGWAVVFGMDSSDVIPYLEIRAHGRKTFRPCVKSARVDVTKHLGSSKYMYCGFRTNLQEEFSASDYECRVVLKVGNKLLNDGTFKKVHIEAPAPSAIKKVAFVGGLIDEKGSNLARDMVRSKPEGIEWYVFGIIGDSGLALMEQDNLHRLGGYNQEDLPMLFKRYSIDLACILPKWPETFCYTLSEAVICNTPVIATDIGAVGDRVKRHGYGLTIPVDTPGAEVVHRIEELFANKEQYDLIKKTACEYQEKTIAEMAKEYAAIYDSYPKRSNYSAGFDRKLIYSGIEYMHERSAFYEESILGRLAAANDQLELQRVDVARMAKIKKTVPFKIAKKVKNIIRD